MAVAGWVCEIDTGGGCGQTPGQTPRSRRRGEEMTDQKCNAAVSQAGATTTVDRGAYERDVETRAAVGPRTCGTLAPRSAGHAAGPLQPPPHAAMRHVHRLAEHERAATHDASDAARAALVDRGLGDAARAE